MRIAQVSPLFESVPPKLYGGTERVVSHLTEELVALGHDVTLFASGDSVTTARLEAVVPRSLRLATDIRDPVSPHFLMLEKLFEAMGQGRFDIVHFHTDPWHFPFQARYPQVAQLTTLHGRLDLPETLALHDVYAVSVVSISDAQRRPLIKARWQGTVHHGLPLDLYKFHEQPGTYLAFLGRISPEKGLDRAIAIAKAAGVPLKIAAKIDAADRQYYREEIAPLMDHPLIEFLGEINDAQKGAFLGGARALLFPIDWPEPFGMVMIEAMACGTPVIAFDCGSVAEVIEDGVSGFIVSSITAAVEAVEKAMTFERRGCRQAFERRFSARRMANDYVALYQKLLSRAETRGSVKSVSLVRQTLSSP